MLSGIWSSGSQKPPLLVMVAVVSTFGWRLVGPHLCINFVTRDGRPLPQCGRAGATLVSEHRAHVPAASVLRAPRLESDSFLLQQAYGQSVLDFAALRIKGQDISD